jgi:hypothetical protein
VSVILRTRIDLEYLCSFLLYKFHKVLTHTVVWVFYVTVIFYILYCGITNTINIYTWIAIGLVFLEGLILLLFRTACPLTLIARKYSDSDKDNFDNFLPNLIARYNKIIFSITFMIGLFLVGYRL